MTTTVSITRETLREAIPQLDGTLHLAGLDGPVDVVRDSLGIPHVKAASTHDAFFAQGFVHAQDRLFQMDLNRRLGLGRLAEIIGPSGVAFDKFARYLGWPRVARAQVAGTDEATAAVIAAYAAGVNAYILTQPLPAEFKLLAYRPEPWDATATSAWGTVLAAWSPDPFRFDDVTRTDHWEYRAIAPNGVGDDAEAGLLDLADHLAAGQRYYYDVAEYIVGRPASRSNSAVYVSVGGGYCYSCWSFGWSTWQPGFHFGISFVSPWRYRPVWYDPWYGCANARGPWKRMYVQSVVSTNGWSSSRSWMHSAAPCLCRTSKTSSCSHERSRSSTAQRIEPGAASRNSSSRCALRFQRGGNCTSVGPRCSPSLMTRSRWLGNHDRASFSFILCEPKAPILVANRNPGRAAEAQPSTVDAFGNR